MRRASSWPWRWTAFMVLLLALAVSVPVSAATLAIDGQFGDWAGQPHVDDPTGDGKNPNTDLVACYWGTNPDDEHVYFMMERQSPSSGNPKVYYFVFLDTNNDGDYGGSSDRMVQVMYDPKKNDSEVSVTVLTGNGSQVSQYSGDWGESSGEGGGRAEWRVSFADLGIDAHQTVNMYAGASQNASPEGMDRVPDGGDITWTPIPILGWPWLVAIFVTVTGLAWYVRRRRRAWGLSSSLP
jgi:hypothetical protein